MAFTATLYNKTFLFAGTSMSDEYVVSSGFTVAVGDIIHIDVDYVTPSDDTFQLVTPYAATIFDGFRGYFVVDADYFAQEDAKSAITFFFDTIVTVNMRVSIYTTPSTTTKSWIDWIGGGASTLSGYIKEDVYVHNDSNRERGYLYNVRKESEVKVVSNQPPTAVKVYDSLEYKSNKPWDVTAIEIPADSTYPHGMSSLIPEARFKKREGVFASDFLRNMKTNQSTAATIDLLKGEQLRGQAMEITLVNDDITEANLFSVTVNASKSRS